MSESQFASAYSFGQENSSLFGDAEFDFLYGLSALESRHYGEAVLALERVRVNNPSDQVAWFHLARGYFLLGEVERAKNVFAAMYAEGVQEPIATRVKEWQNLATKRELERTGASRLYAEVGLGYDTNINAGVGEKSVDLSEFGFGVYETTEKQREVGDSKLIAGAGGQYSFLVQPGVTAFFGGDFSHHANVSNSEFNQTSLGGYGGFAKSQGGQQYRLTMTANMLMLGSDYYRSVLGLAGEWSSPLSSKETLIAYGQAMVFDYIGSNNDNRDSHLIGLGGAYRTLLGGGTLTASGGFAQERNSLGFKENSRDIWNASVGVIASPWGRLRMGGAIDFQLSPYGDEDPILLERRKDYWQHLSINATYLLIDNISIRGDLSWMKNESNIDLYDYDRAQLTVKLRYDFR